MAETNPAAPLPPGVLPHPSTFAAPTAPAAPAAPVPPVPPIHIPAHPGTGAPPAIIPGGGGIPPAPGAPGGAVPPGGPPTGGGPPGGPPFPGGGGGGGTGTGGLPGGPAYPYGAGGGGGGGGGGRGRGGGGYGPYTGYPGPPHVIYYTIDTHLKASDLPLWDGSYFKALGWLSQLEEKVHRLGEPFQTQVGTILPDRFEGKLRAYWQATAPEWHTVALCSWGTLREWIIRKFLAQEWRDWVLEQFQLYCF